MQAACINKWNLARLPLGKLPAGYLTNEYIPQLDAWIRCNVVNATELGFNWDAGTAAYPDRTTTQACAPAEAPQHGLADNLPTSSENNSVNRAQERTHYCTFQVPTPAVALLATTTCAGTVPCTLHPHAINDAWMRHSIGLRAMQSLPLVARYTAGKRARVYGSGLTAQLRV